MTTRNSRLPDKTRYVNTANISVYNFLSVYYIFTCIIIGSIGGVSESDQQAQSGRHCSRTH